MGSKRCCQAAKPFRATSINHCLTLILPAAASRTHSSHTSLDLNNPPVRGPLEPIEFSSLWSVRSSCIDSTPKLTIDKSEGVGRDLLLRHKSQVWLHTTDLDNRYYRHLIVKNPCLDMAPSFSPLQSRTNLLTTRLWRQQIEPKIVMADSSVHDVVNQPQSVGAAPTDVSGSNTSDSTVRAVPENDSTVKTSDTYQETLPPTEENDASYQKNNINIKPEELADIGTVQVCHSKNV